MTHFLLLHNMPVTGSTTVLGNIEQRIWSSKIHAIIQSLQWAPDRKCWLRLSFRLKDLGHPSWGHLKERGARCWVLIWRFRDPLLQKGPGRLHSGQLHRSSGETDLKWNTVRIFFCRSRTRMGHSLGLIGAVMILIRLLAIDPLTLRDTAWEVWSRDCLDWGQADSIIEARTVLRGWVKGLIDRRGPYPSRKSPHWSEPWDSFEILAHFDSFGTRFISALGAILSHSS
jgi:hypothetical protein